MWDWLSTTSRDLKVWQQLAIEACKLAGGLVTVLVVTRWTLSRADRKDANARQASILQDYMDQRISALRSCSALLAKVQVDLISIRSLDERMAQAMGDEAFKSRIVSLFDQLDAHLDELLVASTAYGHIPESLKSEFGLFSEPISGWIALFYQTTQQVRENDDDHIGELLGELIGRASHAQLQIVALIDYEVSMALAAVKEPWKAWSTVVSEELQRRPLPILQRSTYDEVEWTETNASEEKTTP